MSWRIRFEKAALKELGKIASPDRERISRYLRDRLARRNDPREIGDALSGALAGLWKYRVGDYRIIARIEDGEVAILVVRIGHRREIYR